MDDGNENTICTYKARLKRKQNGDGFITYKWNAADHEHINDISDKIVKERVAELQTNQLLS